MILHFIVGEESFPIDIPEEVLQDGADLYDKMDKDMDKGWQIGRYWVDNPSVEQRCQVAADKILTALHTENSVVATMMAGYICTHMPGVTRVFAATNGELQETEFE